MTKHFQDGDRRIRVRGIRRNEPDLRKLARALVDLAQAQAEAEAEKGHVVEEKANVVDLPRLEKFEDDSKDAA